MPSQTEYLLYVEEGGVEYLSYLEQLQRHPGLDRFFWLDITNPTEKDLQWLETSLSIHPLTIEDITLGESREKCEHYLHYIFISLQLLDETDFYGKVQSPLRYYNNSTSDILEPVSRPKKSLFTSYLLIFSHFLVSVHWSELPCREALLVRRIPMTHSRPTSDEQSQSPSIASTGSTRTFLTADWLAYLIIDEIVDGFVRQCALLESEVDAIDDLAGALGRFDQMDLLRRIYQAHRRVTLLGRLIQPKLDVIKSLAKHFSTDIEEEMEAEARKEREREEGKEKEQVTERENPTYSVKLIRHRTVLYLRDVTDHLHSVRADLGEFGETLNRVHDNYLGRSDIELAVMGHKMDLTVKKITSLAFAIGFAIVISSIMGMNVRVPFQEYPRPSPGWTLLIPFFTLLLGMTAISGAIFLIGRRQRWL